jgi:L-rhamnonate dehydratase
MEEILPSEDFDAHGELRSRIPWQTLATGEHWYSTVPFQHAASKHLIDIMQPDINWVGGMTPIVKICAIAEAANISVIPHGGGNTVYGQHACYAMPAIPWTECFIASPPGIPIEDAPRLPGQAFPKNGKMIPTDGPGFGLDIDISKLEILS